MAEVKRETPSQRMHYRLSVPIFIEVDGKSYKAADWSMGGFRLDGYEGPLGKDELFTPEISIDFRGFHIAFKQESRVVRAPRDGDGILAVTFHEIKQENLELLKYFSEGLLGGEMASFQDAIRRVDMPVTPVDMELIEEANEPPIKRSLKRMLIAFLYIVVGGAILTYIAITVYANVVRIEVESGVVVAPTEPLVSPVSGIFVQLMIPSDLSITLGKPVIQLLNQEIEKDYASIQVALSNARFRMHSLEAQLGVERSTLGIYSRVGDSRLASAQERVAALKQDLALARRDVARKVNLQSKGAVSQADLEAAQQQSEKLQKDLSAAENDLRIAHVALGGLRRSGLFFSGDRVEGRGFGLKGELQAARRSVWALEEDLNNLNSTRAEYLIRAPFDGHVVRVLKTPGNTVDRGDNLAVIERDDTRYLEAYLTQLESTQVRLGTIAKVFIPSLNIEREAKIIQIDRTRGFVEEIDSRYRWRTTVDRTAVATLFFIDKAGKNAQVKDIVTGTPATVNFERHPTNPLLAAIFNFFRSKESLEAEKNATTEAMSYEFRQVVRMQGPTSRRTEAGTQVTVPVSQNATLPAAQPAQAPQPIDPCKTAQSLLWPGHFFTQLKPDSLSPAVRSQLEAEAKRALAKAPAPVATLRSAGQTDKEDAIFVASRRAMQDADNAANLALAYRVFGERSYFDKAAAILLAWAKVNKPTGNPVDETRLDKLIFAYDLLRCELSPEQKTAAQSYLRKLQSAKLAWKYGENTANNNHRTHQLKMLLLLARVLEDGPAFDKALAEAREHLKNNIDAASGETLDHKERGALHYQAYDLEAWLEIALLDDSVKAQAFKAYEFLRNRIIKGDIHYEFKNSTAPIDQKRDKAGFDYAAKGGTFDTAKAARSLLTYRTLQGLELNPTMQRLIEGEATPVNLFIQARQQVWRK